MEEATVVQAVLGVVWGELGAELGGDALARLALLSRNPFRWHTVLEAVMHGSTWPDTARGISLLLGALLGSRDSDCSSSCVSCGQESTMQKVCHSVFAALNVPKHASSGSGHFVMSFAKFITALFVYRESPFFQTFKLTLNRSERCLMNKFFPTNLFDFLKQFQGPEFAQYFNAHSTHSCSDVNTFLLLLVSKAWEASAVEGGRNFDKTMTQFFVPPELRKSSLDAPPLHPTLLATSAVELVRHTLRAMFLPVDAWAVRQSVSSPTGSLTRCTEFMEPSVVLQIIKQMLLVPGAIPPLVGDDASFGYRVEDVHVTNCDISRAICLLKQDSQNLMILVKDVNVQVEHSWRIERNKGSFYFGTNLVTVRGLSATVFLSLDEELGPQILAAKLNLGSVEHQCRIQNANFVSAMVAQAALDWFADPLTRLIQTAAQQSLEALLQRECEWFGKSVWKSTILTIFPKNALANVVHAIRTALPTYGVSI